MPLDCVLQDEENREEKEKQQGYRQFIRTKSDDGVEENGEERELDFLFDVRDETKEFLRSSGCLATSDRRISTKIHFPRRSNR